MKQDSSGSTVSGCKLDDRALIPGRERDLSVHHCVQTAYGIHSASYTMSIEDEAAVSWC
jgi:hypothetical protein